MKKITFWLLTDVVCFVLYTTIAYCILLNHVQSLYLQGDGKLAGLVSFSVFVIVSSIFVMTHLNDSVKYIRASSDEVILSIYKNQAIRAVKDGKVISHGVDSFGNKMFKIETVFNTPLKGEVEINADWLIKPFKLDKL